MSASVAVAAGILSAAPGTPASQAAMLRAAAPPRSQGATSHAGVLTGRTLEIVKSRLSQQQTQLLARQAADRGADRRAAARRAAAQQAGAAATAQRVTAQDARQTRSPRGRGAAPRPSGSPEQIALGMLASFGWPSSQFSCLQSLWNVESGWNVHATNPSSGAYGIPQALPGSKMASAGPGWQTNAATQIRWGLGYIRGNYGSPCAAWAHEQADGWY